MCKWGIKIVQVRLIKRSNGHTHAPIDPCIAPIVQALNDGGIETVASCCGHGKRPGNIALSDGRELIISPDYKTGRQIDKAFPSINPASQPYKPRSSPYYGFTVFCPYAGAQVP